MNQDSFVLRGARVIDPANKFDAVADLVVKNGKIYRRWSNQTDSGQSNLGPSKTRGKDRSLTYEGIAYAMAQQWG